MKFGLTSVSILLGIILLFASVLSLSPIVDSSHFEGIAETEGSLIKINGNDFQTSLFLSFEDSDGDGFEDLAVFTIRNEGDFSFKGKILNLSVTLNESEFLVERSGNGIWSFYYDKDGDGAISNGDIAIGRVKIIQGSSSLDGDVFTVSENDEKKITVKLEYYPYASNGTYRVYFEIAPVYEERS